MQIDKFSFSIFLCPPPHLSRVRRKQLCCFKTKRICKHGPWDNGLNFNPNKCVQCMFSFNGNTVTDPDLKANISGNNLSAVESVTYLGVTFSRNAKWTTHIEDIFRKRVRLSFCVKKFRMLSTPTEFIRKFVEACILPLSLLFSSHIPCDT